MTDHANESTSDVRVPIVAIASLGGTITMTAGEASAGVRPTLDVSRLIEAVPDLGAAASLRSTTLAMSPGASLTFTDIVGALHWAEAAIEEGADGAVLVQGTDTIEETSYLADLYWSHAEPLVVTGAMRPPQAAGADGPANLLAATRVAGSPAARDRGVLVVLNDEIHYASRVRKTRSSGLAAFSSPDFGVAGYVEEARAVFGGRMPRRPALAPARAGSNPRIALLETTLGDDGFLIDVAAAAGFDGIVVDGFGVGHVPDRTAEALKRAVRDLPIVFSTRTGSGTTYSDTYGFPGSESDLAQAGLIASGWLDARKARILLWGAIASGLSIDQIKYEFGRRGGDPEGSTQVQ